MRSMFYSDSYVGNTNYVLLKYLKDDIDTNISFFLHVGWQISRHNNSQGAEEE